MAKKKGFEIPDRLKSRKFLMAMGTVVAIVFGLDPEMVSQLLMIIVPYILAQGYVDAKKIE